MAGNISKGRILRLLDKHLVATNDVQPIIDQLLGGDSLSDIVRDLGATAGFNFLQSVERKHLDRHWFGILEDAKLTYWPQIPQNAKDAILREGFLDALHRASTVAGSQRLLDKSIVSYWLCAGSHFEVVVCDDSSEQLTVLILTPSIAWRYLGRRRGFAGTGRDNIHNPDGPLTKNEDIYVFGGGQDIRNIAHEANKRRLQTRGDTKLVTTKKRRFDAAVDMTHHTRSYIVKGDPDNFIP
jgi:hypothetical protein